MIDSETINYVQKDRKCITRIICFSCNNNCVSCVTNYDKSDKKMHFSLDDVKKIIDSFDKDTNIIDYNGGEPTLRKDLLEIIRYTRERFPDAYIQLLTNGRMFYYGNYVEKFRKCGIGKIRFMITIYGHNEKVHDAITRAPGSFRETVAGIRNLIGSGFDVEVRIIITKMNYRHFPQIARFVCSIPGIRRVVFVNAKIVGEAYRNRDSVLVGYSDLREYAEKAGDYLLRMRDKMEIRYFHFPFCILGSKYWELVEGVTVPYTDITFGPECEKCSKRTTCPGIWASYADLRGFGEFRPIS